MTFSLKGLKTITNYQYEPACGILSLLDIWIFPESLDVCPTFYFLFNYRKIRPSENLTVSPIVFNSANFTGRKLQMSRYVCINGYSSSSHREFKNNTCYRCHFCVVGYYEKLEYLDLLQ